MADRKYVHKHVSSLAAHLLYKRWFVIDNLLRASPELVIEARNGNKNEVFYLLNITRYKYATNTEIALVKLK